MRFAAVSFVDSGRDVLAARTTIEVIPGGKALADLDVFDGTGVQADPRQETGEASADYDSDDPTPGFTQQLFDWCFSTGW
jgi:hypothetical protein